ncbi:inorganic phosphate transporter [Haloferax sp. ATB1]|uniref:inorganic phosphate transporter n=1 Tax=Haloferax sp. ATB1 TaxID=1508454 RepID=UPI0005B1F9FB|nr:inorganic phosphate transporter [Haloferax sp. ATB1]
MVEAAVVGTLVVATAASLFMAWTIGAGSSGSTPFAPAVGANSISVMRAGFVVGILGFLGAITQGANVSKTVGSGLVQGVTLSPLAATLSLLIAGLLVSIGVFTGYPIATAFTVTGAVTGVGIALGGNPAWMTYGRIATLWILTPFLGGGAAYFTARLLRSNHVPNRVLVPSLGGVTAITVVNMEFIFLGPPGATGSVAWMFGSLAKRSDHLSMAIVALSIGCSGLVGYLSVSRQFERHRDRTLRRLLLLLGGLVAFSAGGTQVGLAVGPVTPLTDSFGISLFVVLIGGGAGLLIGSWTGAPRMIKALSRDYSALGPQRSIAALIPSFLIAQSAVFLGVPVSFNEIMVSAIIGSGYAATEESVSRTKIRNTVFAWIASFMLAIFVGYVTYRLLIEILIW